MKINKNKYPEAIMQLLRQSMELEFNDTSKDELINKMTRNQLLGRLLRSHGIIGLQNSIKDWIEGIYGVGLLEEEDLNKGD